MKPLEHQELVNRYLISKDGMQFLESLTYLYINGTAKYQDTNDIIKSQGVKEFLASLNTIMNNQLAQIKINRNKEHSNG